MRRTKSQIRDEYIRLASCWEYACEYISEAANAEGGFNIADHLPTKEDLIVKFDNGDIKASELLSGMQQGLTDSVHAIQYDLEAGHPETSEFLKRYETETGRDFFADAGDPQKIARKIVKRGVIKNESEFYILKEILSDLEQITIPKKDTQRAYEMLDLFEFGNAK